MAIEKKSLYVIGGVLMSIAGSILFSTKAVFVKLTYAAYPVDPIALLALRMLFSLPFFVISAAISSQRKGNARFTPTQWIYVAMVGLLGYYVSSFLDFAGLQFINAGIERLILFTYPTFVLIISTVFFKKRAGMGQWIAVGITYAGLLIAFASEVQLQQSREFYFGSALIFACAITFAMHISASGVLIPVVGALKFNSYAMSFAGIGVLLHYWIASDQPLTGLPPVVYGYAVAMALLGTVIPSYLVSLGIKRLGSNMTAVIASVGPVSTIIQAYYLLGEPFTLMQGIGTTCILAGIVVLSWKRTTKVLPVEDTVAA